VKVLVSWLRDFVDLPADARAIGDALTSVGLAVDGVEPRDGGDAVLDLDITTNRVDAMNVYGVARELSVFYKTPLKPPATTFGERGTAATEVWSVEIEAPDLCPRFCGRVLDVRLGPSPEWMRARLEAAGVRPISNVVDLTNYVMLELGHPSHAFDLDKVPNGRLVVRWARAGEKVATLDGQTRDVRPGIGVIAGAGGPLALAGIMGGASSEVSEKTRAIALEAAYWDPLAVRRAAKALGMHTEASHRFERGADPEGPPPALARIAHLAERIGAGTTRPGLIDRNVRPIARRSVSFRPARATALLGAPVPAADARRILTGLGFVVGTPESDAVAVAVPTWRGDVAREADIIEEVGRHMGLGRIPSTIPPAGGAEGLRPRQKRDRVIRDVLAGAGLTETISYSFVPASEAVPQGPVLANPLSEDQKVLRGSLVWPGLLATMRTNLRQARTDVRIFEVGRVFDADGGESERLGILITGAAAPAHPAERPRPSDFADLKGVLELLAARLGVGPVAIARGEGPSFLHPGQSGALRVAGTVVGYAGAIDPARAAEWEARGTVLVAEVAPLPEAARVRVRALPRFPAVERDLSVLCDAQTEAADVEAAIRGAAGERLRKVAATARFDRPPVPAGKVSLTFRLVFQDPARTLTGDEVQSGMDAVAAALRGRGFTLRQPEGTSEIRGE
jgi:phenylalanyl-tRNA synthetase beta chain